MDKLGPLCRTAEDCGWVLQSMAGADKADPASAGKSFYYTPQYARPLKELRIGYSPADFSEWADAAARPAFDKALAVVKEMGVTLVEAKLPDFPYPALANTIITCEGASVFESLIKSGGIDQLADPKQAAGFRAGLQIPAKDYLKAMRIRSLLQTEFHKLFSDLDALVSPTRPGTAPRIDEPLDKYRQQSDKAIGLSALIPAGNLAGIPAISVPCGLVNGMPVGLQFAGPAFTENTLLALGKEFQSRTDWHRQRPPV
jgi:aspartyl-tRNA(Asn)/glutamyl-tRNA(Gln) amidotransferase subunit A